MENLAFIYSAVAYEDGDTNLQMRSLNELGIHIPNSPIVGIMGAAIVVSVITQSPANATLIPGNTCAAVGTAQAALQAQGYSVGGVDDIYGNNTQYTVEQFQSDHGLSSDGIIGPVTASALGLDPNISCGNGSGGGGGDNGSAYVNTNGDPLNVRSGPGTGYSTIDSLPDGTSVSIVNQQGNWGELPSGGWVSLNWISGL